MNRIKGSAIAKVIAWLLLMVSAVVCIGSFLVMMAMEDYGVFRQKKEKAIEEEWSYISENYAVRVVDHYRNGLAENNEKYFNKDKAFYYGIIEAESLDNIDLNDENSYSERNFTGNINQEEMQVSTFRLGEGALVWYYDGIFGESGYFEEGDLEKTLYADRICYDTTGGIFYYRAEGKYYPIQNVDLVLIRELEDGTYEMQDFDFGFDNVTRKYKNYDLLNDFSEHKVYENRDMDITATIEMPQMQEMWLDEEEKIKCSEQPILKIGSYELAMLLSETELTFQQFDGTLLEYTKLGSIIFDGIRRLNASELTLIDSAMMSQDDFVEVEEAYLDEYYTLHVQEKDVVKNYIVVSYIDTAVIEAEKERFLSSLGENTGYLEILEAIVMSKDVNSYASVSVLMDILYEMEKEIVGIFFGSMGVFLVCFGFLLCAAGHRRKREEIVLTFVDRIPLDILCVIVFFLEAFAVAVLIEIGYMNAVAVMIQLYVGIGIMMAAMVVVTLLSFAVRVKMGKWWRNSLTYWIVAKFVGIGKGILHGCGVLWKNIHILWKVVAVLLVIGIVVVFLGACMGAGEEFMVAMLFAGIIACPILILMVLQFQKLQIGSRLIAEGNLQYKIDTKRMFWEFKKHAENLNRINEGMAHAVEERMKSERFKTELITNVSHDIKTPLTSIINYVDLLEKTDIQDENAKEYLEVLERQSARLKKLIEDLIEASKASTGNLAVGMEEIEANVFVTQILGEFEEKLSKANLELIINKPEKEIPVLADGRHLWRVVDNLMNNICKYAQPNSRVYINLEETSDSVLLIFKNMSKYPLNITSEELMERFVRGDSSRNTEGNGLGLSIAKSLMELMNGTMLLYVDGDLFKVVLELPR